MEQSQKFLRLPLPFPPIPRQKIIELDMRLSPFFLHVSHALRRGGSELLLVCFAIGFGTFGLAQDTTIPRLEPWTSSNVKGSPDAPLPYKTSRIFERVRLNQPTDVCWLPDAQRWIATQVEGSVVSFENDPSRAVATPLLDLNPLHPRPIHRAFSTLFHPDLKNNPWCFVTYASEPNDPQGAHLVRFTVLNPEIPEIDLSSRVVLASWNSAGHGGGSMRFGSDGYLYVSVGDGQNPYPPDKLNTGQDLTDLEASILRIDVNNPSDDHPYRIPPDNPFVGRDGVRGEIWAFGFRNPWKMAFHPTTGDLFAADVGWEMREMIYRVKPGANYGWSLMEGSQPVKQIESPTIPISPPLFEHTHVDSRSITGGFFWQSKRFPELQDAFIYGDWMTGKVWALKSDGDRVLWQKELVDTPNAIICFMLDPTGETFMVGYDGTILRLEQNTQPIGGQAFPTKLSDTGLFKNVVDQVPAQGVIEYEISSHHWADGTHSQQWIAVPNSEQLGLWENPSWETGQVHGRFKFPKDTVLAKTISYFVDSEDSGSERRLETQLLHLLEDEWRAYNYLWNEEQTDATLQSDTSSESQLKLKDSESASGFRTQTWHHSSRSECLLCHIWSSGTILGFAPDQLDISWRDEMQMAKLRKQGLFAVPVHAPKTIPSPHDASQPLPDRARAYLSLNCSSCHRPQGGGTANFSFDIVQSLEKNNYLGALPAQGDFGIADARIVAPGDPFRSIVLYRTLKSGRGHMPQFGSNLLDPSGVQLLHDWIASMPSTGTNSIDAKTFLDALHQSSSEETIASTLGTTTGAMALSFACASGQLQEPVRSLAISQGANHPDPQIRDLFEGFLPEESRVKRLGPAIDAQTLLARAGSVESGKSLFENAADVNCRLCHRIGEVGQKVGPDLSGIGTQQTPAEILRSILLPSEKIATEYRTRNILTSDGTIRSGLIVRENESELLVSDSQGKVHAIAKEEIEQIQPNALSIMPDMLLSGLTEQQAADLIAYLSAQRAIGPLQHKHYSIRRTSGPVQVDGRIDESAWAAAPVVGDFVFTWWNDGDGQRQPTEARMLWDDKYLYVSFHCFDRDIQANRTTRDSDVYRDDCVEVFASPEMDHPENYFNLEMNALGTTLDNYRMHGVKPESDWNPDGILVAVSIAGSLNDASDTDQAWSLEVAVPFALFQHVLKDGHPHPGDQWRLNLNRLEDNMSVKSQWSQGDRNKPVFHTPEFFGFIEFVE